jgi:glutamate transport system substrate-binding protein
MRARIALAGLAVLALTAAGCGAGGDESSIVGKESLVIGVKPDQPGLGLKKRDGVYEGFDVDVAKAIVDHLKGAGQLPQDVTVRFMDAPSSEREKLLQSRKVDFIVASYSITPERKTKVAFAGPYYVAHQDILVRQNQTGIRNVRDLAGRRLCAVDGSNSDDRVQKERGIPITPVQSASYSECIEKLKNNEVDAVSTDDLILAGFAAQPDNRNLRVVNARFTDERYGVGIHKTDIEGCEAINKAITTLYQNGTIPKLLNKWFGGTGLNLQDATSVPQFEGCD